MGVGMGTDRHRHLRGVAGTGTRHRPGVTAGPTGMAMVDSMAPAEAVIRPEGMRAGRRGQGIPPQAATIVAALTAATARMVARIHVAERAG